MSEKAELVQPPPYPQSETQSQVVVVQQQQAQGVTPLLGEFPTTVNCPQGHQVMSNVYYKSGTMVWVVAGLMVLFGLLCFAWIPFFVDSLKDVVHTCPQDGTVIGVYQRLKI